MISVEIYNASLYGTYGGWIFVASDKYSFTTTSVTINETVLDANTTMARVSYYYNFCEGGVESALYYLRAVETITTGYTQVDQAIENVLVQVKRYINSTGTFVDVSSIFTDANGYVNIYLVPNAHYKIFLNKSGYDDVIGADYIPAPPNAYGQTESKTFRMTKIENVPELPQVTEPAITGYIDSATMTLYVNYTDVQHNTTNVQIYVYSYNSTTNLQLLIGTGLWIGNSNFQDSFLLTNLSLSHIVIIYYNHTVLGTQVFTLTFPGNVTGGLKPITTQSKFDALFTANYGTNPFGWSNFICWIILLIIYFEGGKEDVGFILIVAGFILLFVNYWIGFNTSMATLAGGGIPILHIILGGMWLWYKGW
jgi:hypothetical protein